MGKLAHLKKALDMTRAARMKRAAEQGFDANRVVYHGTTDLPGIQAEGFSTAYERMKREMGEDFQDPDRRFFFAEEEDLARQYSDDVIPAYLRMSNPKVIDWGGKQWNGSESAIQQAKAEGYDGVILKNVIDTPSGKGEPSNVRVVFDPENIRSVDAAFDPDNAGKTDIMGSVDPKLLAPLAGVGAIGAMSGDVSAAEQSASMPLDSVKAASERFKQRRQQRRYTLQGLLETGATLGSGMVGGVIGDLSRLGGYLNPFMPVERTEAGARALSNALQYQPSPEASPYLERIGEAVDQFEQDLSPLTEPVGRSIPGQAYQAMPERARKIVETGAGLAF